MLAVVHVGGDLGWEIVYFGSSGVHYTHLGCFGTRGGAGGGGGAYRQSQTNQNFSQLGNWCQWGLLRLGFAPGLVVLGFLHFKTCKLLAIVYLHIIYHVSYIWRGRNGWMAVDRFG